MKTRAYQIDLGRQVERPEWVMAWIPHHAAWGYNVLVLYLEDAFRFPSHPAFAQPRAWTPRDLERVVRCAGDHGMTVIPVVPSLGHTAYALKHPAYRHLGERRDERDGEGRPVVSGQLCPSLAGGYALLADLYRDIAPFCTAGYLHVSLDESFDLGVCPRCRARVARGGAGGLFVAHLRRVHGLVRRLDLRPAIWGDMFYYFPEAIAAVPRDVAVFDWYYYPFRRRPRVELFNFRELDSAGALVRAGLETWACPMNGPFFSEIAPPFAERLGNIVSWWNYGRRVGAHAICVTSWSPTHAAAELTNLVNAAAAELWLAPGAGGDIRAMLENGLRRLYGARAADAAAAAVGLLDRHPLYGYWRDQALRAPLSRMATLDRGGEADAAVRDFARRLPAARAAPPALRHTVTIRDYTLRRERLSRHGSALLADARRRAAAGRPVAAVLARIEGWRAETEAQRRRALSATRALWRLSRHARQENPLAAMLRGEGEVLRRLGRFLAAAGRAPQRLDASCDLLGARQLVVTVRCRRPCLQGLAIEVAADGGTWRPLQSLYLLEFSAATSRPLTNSVRRHTVPLPDDLAPREGAWRVRLRAVGLGEVEVSRPRLLDGARLRAPDGLTGQRGRVRGAAALPRGGWARLGAAAPRAGFAGPDDFAREHAVTLSWSATGRE